MQITEVVFYSAIALLLGGASAFFEIFSKFKNDYERAVLRPACQTFIILNGTLALAAFLVLYKYYPSLAWSVPVRAMVAGLGLPVLLRAKMFSIETTDGKSYGVGLEALYTLFQDLFIRRIDDHLKKSRAKVLRHLKMLDSQVLRDEVETLVAAARTPRDLPQQVFIEATLARFGKDEDRKRKYLAELLLNNATIEFNLEILERTGISLAESRPDGR